MIFKTILHRAIRLLYPHGSVRKVLRGPLRGTRFVVAPGMGATYAWGVDSMNLAFLLKHVQAGWNILDVGANCGQMALFFARVTGPRGRVLSLEPVPDNFARLERNLKMNDCRQVKALCLAAGRKKATLLFDFDSEKHTQGTFAEFSLPTNDFAERISVQCETLDAIAQGEGILPHFVKIDVEGSGGEVISGAVHMLEEHRPAIYFEVHALNDDSPELAALRQLKDRWGYRIIDMSGVELKEFKAEWGIGVWCEPPCQETPRG